MRREAKVRLATQQARAAAARSRRSRCNLALVAQVLMCHVAVGAGGRRGLGGSAHGQGHGHMGIKRRRGRAGAVGRPCQRGPSVGAIYAEWCRNNRKHRASAGSQEGGEKPTERLAAWHQGGLLRGRNLLIGLSTCDQSVIIWADRIQRSVQRENTERAFGTRPATGRRSKRPAKNT